MHNFDPNPIIPVLTDEQLYYVHIANLQVVFLNSQHFCRQSGDSYISHLWALWQGQTVFIWSMHREMRLNPSWEGDVRHGNCAGKEEAGNDGRAVFRNNVSEWYLLSLFVFRFRLSVQSLNLRPCIWDFVFTTDWYFCPSQLDLIEAGPWNKKFTSCISRVLVLSRSPQSSLFTWKFRFQIPNVIKKGT